MQYGCVMIAPLAPQCVAAKERGTSLRRRWGTNTVTEWAGALQWPLALQVGATAEGPLVLGERLGVLPRQGFARTGRRSGGQLRAVTKRLGRAVQSVGGQSLAVGKAGGGGVIGVVPSGRVVGGALGAPPPFQAKPPPFPPPLPSASSVQYGEDRAIALPSSLTTRQRRVLVALHSLSHAAHDSADGLLALADVLLADGPPDAPAGASEARTHRQRLHSVYSTAMQKLHRHVSRADVTAAPEPDPLAARLSFFGVSDPCVSDSDSDCGAFAAAPAKAGPGPAEEDGGAELGNGSDLSGGSGSGGSGGGWDAPPNGTHRLDRRGTVVEPWTTSVDRRLQLLRAIADRYEAGHPWVPAFVTALSESERGHAPFESNAAREQLRRGLGVTLGAGAGPAQGMWRLMLIAVWGGEGHWAVLLLKAALLRTQIDFELVFDLFDCCLSVARAQVRAIAALLLNRLRYDGYAREQHLGDLERSMAELRAGDGNVWVLPGRGAPQPGDLRGLAVPGPEWPPGDRPGGPTPAEARVSGGATESPPADAAPRTRPPLALEAEARRGCPDGGTAAPSARRAPRAPPSGASEKGEQQWTWITLEPAPPKESTRRPSLLLRRSLERARTAAGGAVSALDPGHVALGDGFLDLSRCWGATADGVRVPPADGDEPPAPTVRAATLARHASRLQWQSGAAGLVTSQRQSVDGAKPSPDPPPQPEPITSSLVKELLVTDYGLDMEPADGLGTCGGCIWDRGLAALAAGRVARAGACFASGHAPVPAALARGADAGDTAWVQFWCMYYAWALGHAAVLPQLQTMVRARRRRAARGLAASVRLLPLPGGAATAATVNAIARREAILPSLVPRPPRSKPKEAPLVSFIGSDCPKHAGLPGLWLEARGDLAEAEPEKSPPAAPEGPSPLPAIVNGLLGFPDTLFVGPTYDAGQRKTGSIFRPFHGLEQALQHVRGGQTVLLLPGTYAPMKVYNVRATAGAPVRIQGLGSVVITTAHKLRGSPRAPLIKVPICSTPMPRTHAPQTGCMEPTGQGFGGHTGSADTPFPKQRAATLFTCANEKAICSL